MLLFGQGYSFHGVNREIASGGVMCQREELSDKRTEQLKGIQASQKG